MPTERAVHALDNVSPSNKKGKSSSKGDTASHSSSRSTTSSSLRSAEVRLRAIEKKDPKEWSSQVRDALKARRKEPCSVPNCKNRSVGQVDSNDDFGEPGDRCEIHNGKKVEHRFFAIADLKKLGIPEGPTVSALSSPEKTEANAVINAEAEIEPAQVS